MNIDEMGEPGGRGEFLLHIKHRDTRGRRTCISEQRTPYFSRERYVACPSSGVPRYSAHPAVLRPLYSIGFLYLSIPGKYFELPEGGPLPLRICTLDNPKPYLVQMVRGADRLVSTR